MLQSDSLWNNRALIDSLETIPGILFGEPDQIIGSAGKIEYEAIGNERYYDFYFEWSDCFDGCDNYRVWHFMVSSDCSVTYLGFDEWGVFGLLPLPSPLNCNISTAQSEPDLANQHIAFPNPTSGKISIRLPEAEYGFTDIMLYDLHGRKLTTLQGCHPAGELDLGNYPSGIYYLTFSQNGEMIERCRVVKQ